MSPQDIVKITGFLAQQSVEHKWWEIGIHLGFTDDQLNSISASPTNSSLLKCLSSMLSKWGQWTPEDARGSTAYATLDSLKKAMKNAGYGLVAQEISNVLP